MNFGEKLYQLRTAQGIYQKQLAEFLGVSIGTISNYENGVHYPDLETLCRFAEYFHVTTDYLLDLTESNMPIDKLNIELADGCTVGTALNVIAALPQSGRRKLTKYLAMIQTCDEELPKKNQMINKQKQTIEQQNQIIEQQAQEIARLKQALGEPEVFSPNP